jgi:hypothetical protein
MILRLNQPLLKAGIHGSANHITDGYTEALILPGKIWRKMAAIDDSLVLGLIR